MQRRHARTIRLLYGFLRQNRGRLSDRAKESKFAELTDEGAACPPANVLRVLPVVLGVGLLIVLVAAWYHGEKGAQRVSVPELSMIAGILVVAAAAIAFVRKDAASVGDVAPALRAGIHRGAGP